MLRKYLLIILLLALAAPFPAGCRRGMRKLPEAAPRSALATLHVAASERILILVPHPDDESLATAGLIRSAVQRQMPVRVVVLNNGDAYRKSVQMRFKTLNPSPRQFRAMGEIRHRESLAAMLSLGLSAGDVIYLSYPDGGTNALFDRDWDCTSLHLGANGYRRAPYAFAYEKNAPYCGENIVRNLSEIISGFRPTMVFYPDPGDYHHDHWATGAFARYALTALEYKGKEFTYLVHRGTEWPVPWAYLPKRYLLPPRNLVGRDEKWFGFYLSADQEKAKAAALRMYKSQRQVMEPFLDAFVRKNELFATYPALKIRAATQMPEFFKGKNLPYAIFQDPERDTMIRQSSGAADLTAAGLVLNATHFWIALQTRTRVSPDVIYGFHLRVFEPGGVRRIDVKVHGGRAYAQKAAANSIPFDAMIPFEFDSNRIVIELPASILPRQANYFMLSLDTFDHKTLRRIDQTAWRVFEPEIGGDTGKARFGDHEWARMKGE